MAPIVDREEMQPAVGVQNVVVMRHGDRIDSFQPLWMANAERPWDPPLTEDGKARARNTGKQLKPARIGFPIHRVVVSPFLRCLQTAKEVIFALCDTADEEDALLGAGTSGNAPVDAPQLKVSIEYGLCEIMSGKTIKIQPKDGVPWFPNVSELEAMLPIGTIDHSAECIYQNLPPWEETVNDARERYQYVILALTNKYRDENILLVTHGEGVTVSVMAFMDGTKVENVEYCAFSKLQRKVSFADSGISALEPFTVLTENGPTGIRFSSLLV